MATKWRSFFEQAGLWKGNFWKMLFGVRIFETWKSQAWREFASSPFFVWKGRHDVWLAFLQSPAAKCLDLWWAHAKKLGCMVRLVTNWPFIAEVILECWGQDEFKLIKKWVGTPEIVLVCTVCTWGSSLEKGVGRKRSKNSWVLINQISFKVPSGNLIILWVSSRSESFGNSQLGTFFFSELTKN